MNMALNQEVKLNFPVTVDAETYASLTVRRATVRDQLMASRSMKDDAGQAVRLAALLTGVADDVIEALDSTDFAAVSKVVQGFTNPGSDAKN